MRITFNMAVICIAAVTILLFMAASIGRHYGRVAEREENLTLLRQAIVVERELKTLQTTYADLKTVIECESRGRHDGVWGDNGRSYGVAQFQQKTFDWLSELSENNGSWQNKAHQIELLQWAIENGYGKYWTCAPQGRR